MLHSHIPKMADTSRATVRHTTLETACKLALALGVRAEDLLENDARESIDKWHSPAIPGIREQHERDRRPDGIGPKGCRASSPFGSGDMEFKPFEPFEPFDWSNEEEDETEKDIKGKKKGKGSDGMGLRTPMPSEPSLFMFPRPNHCRCVFTWPPPILPHAKEPHLPLIESEFLQSTNQSRSGFHDAAYPCLGHNPALRSGRIDDEDIHILTFEYPTAGLMDLLSGEDLFSVLRLNRQQGLHH